jgi:HK97 family phage major capsid protein
MSDLKDLVGKRVNAVEEGRVIVLRAKEDDRPMNAEERAQVTAINKDIEGYKERIESLQLEATMAKQSDELEEVRDRAPRNTPGNSTLLTREQRGSQILESDEYRTAYDQWIRTGEKTPELRANELLGAATTGGTLVPTFQRNSIIEKLGELVVMRQLATVITTASTTTLPVEDTTGAATWGKVNQAANRPVMTFGDVTLDARKLFSEVRAAIELLQDETTNIEGYINGKHSLKFAEAEEVAFCVGNPGAADPEPNGFLNDSVEGVKVASSFSAAAPFDAPDLFDLFHSLKPTYRAGATWLMDDLSSAFVRQLTVDPSTTNNNWVWQPGLAPGAPDTILGKPVRYSSGMPLPDTQSNKAIAFGNFSYYYIGDRGQMTTQRLVEKYAEVGLIGFLATRRVDATLTIAEAIKHMELADA